jgi:hypothetical protein
MKTLIHGLAFLVGVASLVCAAELGNSTNYKSDIQDFVTLRVRSEHPEFGKLYFGFSKPGRVLFGEKRTQRTAVVCHWGAALKNGDPLLMAVMETFLVDEGFVYPVSPKERLEWVDGSPKIDKDQSNQLPDPTSPSVTPPAGAGVAPSVAADH